MDHAITMQYMNLTYIRAIATLRHEEATASLLYD